MAQTTISSHNPATGELLGKVDAWTPELVTGGVTRSRNASERWSKTSYRQRASLLLKAKDIILEKSDEIIDLVVSETGKPRMEAVTGEVLGALESIVYYAKNARRLLRSRSVGQPWYKGGGRGNLLFGPKGVVGVIGPCNYPFYTPLNIIVQALVTGNTVILKPSEKTPLVGEKMGEILRKAGLPKDVFIVAQGDGTVGQCLVESDVNMVAFTGSVATGRRIFSASAEKMHSIVLELGGSDPCIVLDDADLERAANGVVWGRFLNAGQVCSAVKRVYVTRNIADRFIDRVVSKTRQLRVGNGFDPETDMGPLISPEQLNLLTTQIQDAKEKGARVLCGGRQLDELGELFYAPTVLVDVDHQMRVLQEETFGPVLPVMAVENADEALRLANDSSYGLCGSVWTRNVKEGKRLAGRIQAGTVWINNVLTFGPATPWGGVKSSGIGRTGSLYGLLEFVNVKHVTASGSKKKSEEYWHPNTEPGLAYYRSANQLLFSPRVSRKLKALLQLVGASIASRRKKRNVRRG